MTEQVTVNLENLSEEDKKKFWDIVEKSNKPQIWEPKDGDKYYIVRSDVVTDSATWYGWACDKYRYKIGNCFKTKEEAEFAAERLKVIAELHRYAKENNPTDFDWTNCVDKWRLYYDLQTGKISTVYNKYGVTFGDIFASSDIAKAAIEKIGRDRLKKYYFGVK